MVGADLPPPPWVLKGPKSAGLKRVNPMNQRGQKTFLDSLIVTFAVFYQNHGLDLLDKSDQKSEQRSGLRDGEMDSVYYY